MVLIGVTGGVGMGKSASADLLGTLGVAVLDTDQVARQVSSPGTDGAREIAREFGSDVIDETGGVQRDRLAAIVFGDPEARRRLEGILHPRIASVWRSQVSAWRDGGVAVAAVIIPLLYEKRYESEFSRVVCLACTSMTQQQRLKDRGWSDSQIRARNGAQLQVGEKMARADFVVWSEGSLGCLHSQWERILRGMVPHPICCPA